MNFFKQVFWVFVLCCVGEVVSIFLPFPMPGSVLALILLFLCLLSKKIRPAQIDTVCDFLLGNMAFIFIPSTVSIIAYIDVFKNILWQFIFICIATTVITFFATAYAVKLTMHILSKKGGNKNA
ncbi:MAG: CidA/LrgA family protein [Clostridia bacterium]|nr:CidA/LrgA family protein [Clostridia bacterium]